MYDYYGALSYSPLFLLITHEVSLQKIVVYKAYLEMCAKQLERRKEDDRIRKIAELKRKGYSDHMISKILKVSLDIVRSVIVS